MKFCKTKITTIVSFHFILTSFIPVFSSAQKADSSLKILSWNIYMLPHRWIHTGQIERSKEIAKALKNEESDIIVFSEAFEDKSRQIIYDGLKERFPYQSGKPEKNVKWKTNSGLWIISKYPLCEIKHIFFRESKGMDRFACKGALLIESEKNGIRFQVIGTHLQSDLKGRDVRAVRLSQFEQIRNELLEPYKAKGLPQFLAGDLNTIASDSINHHKMLTTLNLNEANLCGDHCFSYDYGNNDVIKEDPQDPQLIDYILFRAEGLKIAGETSVKVFRNKWDTGHSDLSDHFAIAGNFKLIP